MVVGGIRKGGEGDHSQPSKNDGFSHNGSSDVVSPGKMQELATGRVIRLKEVPMIGFCGPTVLVIGDSFTR
jgi:hypothetical protein